jgi:hypothetical protein
VSGYTALPTKNPGDVLTSALWNTYLQGNADSGFMRMLADTTLGSPAASIDFTSIPQTFAHLRLVLSARDTGAVTLARPIIRFNGDTAANYAAHWIENLLGVATANSSGVTTGLTCTQASGASATASLYGVNAIDIPDYRGTTAYQEIAATFHACSTGGSALGSAGSGGGFWNALAAVTRITIVAGNTSFAAGTRATLYGLPA